MFIRFLKESRGGVAPMMAVLALPLMGAVGVAIDFSRANATRTAFQAALDSTALMLSKTAATAGDAGVQAAATNYVNALFVRPDVSNVAVTAVYTPAGGTPVSGSKVTLNGSATINTNFLGVLGYSQLNITARSVSTWGNTRLRVALVLDNTGSMTQGGTSSNGYTSKMDALKTASQNLLTQLHSAAANPDDVYVSIIPFSKDVNVKTANDTYTQAWLRWDLWEEVNGSCSVTKYKKKSDCIANSGAWTPNDHSTWNGCVTDRDQNFDTTNDAPVAGATLYPTEQYKSCPVSLIQLSNNWDNLSAKITAMTPAGNTNQAIGLQMGWQSLTAAPFTIPAIDPTYQYQQVIVLLTDGLNTQDRWYTSQSSIDTRQQKTCDNIKAANITIYTVQVNTGGDPTSTLLQNCASDSSKFFLLTSSEQIVATFNQIGTALTKLRLAM